MSEHKKPTEGDVAVAQASSVTKEASLRLDQLTKNQLIEKFLGAQMRCEQLIVMVESLQRRVEILSNRASKDRLKAEAYREMMSEVLADHAADGHEVPEYESADDGQVHHQAQG